MLADFLIQFVWDFSGAYHLIGHFWKPRLETFENETARTE